jgi:hypothetical protein
MEERRLISLPCNHTFRDPGGNHMQCPICGRVFNRNGFEFLEVYNHCLLPQGNAAQR